jgi:TP901 family phage tail tape measure protein
MAIEIAGKVNSSFGSTFTSAAGRLQQLNQRISSLRAELRELEKAQKTGAISTEEYAASYAKLTDQLQKAERAQKNLAGAINLEQRVDEFRGRMRAGLLGAVETAVTVGAPVKMAMDFESAMADVRKVVDFETPKQFAEMSRDILTLSTRIPMAASGLAQIVAAGGQAGIAREELISFADAAAKMGVAFDITAEEAGQMMAEWRAAFRMNQQQVVALADQINYLGNTTAASAPKISEVVRRIGPLGEVGGAAAGQIAALGATMVSAGITEEVAATGIKNLILGLTAGEGATKSQAEAFKALGLNAKTMAKLMQKDAEGAILKVLRALQKLPEYKRAAVLSDLFGKESIGAIAPLLTNLGALEQNFKKVGDASQYTGSMQKEFEARAATAGNSLILLKNRAAALGISIGNILLPYVTILSNKAAEVIGWVQRFADEHPQLAKAVTLGTSSVLGLSVALWGLGYVSAIIATPFIKLYAWTRRMELGQKLATGATKAWTAAQWLWNMAMKAGQGLLSAGRLALYYGKMVIITAATKAWTAAQWLFNAALNANPIGLVIAGIGLLIGAGYLLIKNWDKVKAWFITLWNDPREALRQFVEGIRNRFAGVFDWLEGKFAWLREKLAWLGDKWDKVKSFLGLGGGENAVAANMSIPRHATGGIFTRPHVAWFAEEGPEAAIPLDGSPRALSIWAKAGEMLGVRPTAGASITYAPVYNIYGGRDVEGQVRRAAKDAEDDFAARFRSYLRQERRLSYA